MNMRETFTDSLRYPFQDIKQFLILFILVLGTYYILIPIILVFGYLYRVIESTLQGSDQLPDFEGLKEISVNGLKYLGVYLIIYRIPLFVLNMVLVTAGVPQILSSNLMNTIMAILVAFLVNIIFFISLARLVKENSFASAFHFKEIRGVIKTITWKKYLAYLAVYTIIFNLLSILVNLATSYLVYLGMSLPIQLISIMMILIAVLLNTYLFMVTSRFIGLIYPFKSEPEDKMDI